MATCVNDEGVNSLSFYVMGIANYSTFYYTCMQIDRIFHFCSTNSVSANV